MLNAEDCDPRIGKEEAEMNQSFMSAMEVAEELGVSKAYAYKVIRELNEELRSKGFQTVSGRINRMYFKERFYLAGKEVKKNVSI